MDPVKCVQMLKKKNDSMSEEVVPIYDEMYLQKREEYVGGFLVGADEKSNTAFRLVFRSSFVFASSNCDCQR